MQDELEYTAVGRAGLTLQNVAHKIPGSPDEPFEDASYAVMAQNGQWLRSNKLSEALQREALASAWCRSTRAPGGAARAS
ncbi:hypothetical protein ACFQ0M_01125 [Kitasatospora aburaviensis]